MSEPRFGVWTPTTERRPECRDSGGWAVVFAWRPDERPREYLYQSFRDEWFCRGELKVSPPSHWMPMPPPPGDAAAEPPEAPARPAVERPPHYAAMSLQPFDAARAWGLGLSLGSAVKYVARHLRKGDPIGDLNKAKACIDDEIAWLEKSGRLATDVNVVDDEC